jgi:hypothetical protein
METGSSLTIDVMKALLRAFLLALIAAGPVFGQNPPLTGDPYASRGKPRSPDGKYVWLIKNSPSIAYVLEQSSPSKVLAEIPAYYPQPDPDNLKYAKACGVFWNSTGTIVALDELNRRRSGQLYFFQIQDGQTRQIKIDALIPVLSTAAETRLVVDPGWQSETRIRLRQSVKQKDGTFAENVYQVDFSIPTRPKIETTK